MAFRSTRRSSSTRRTLIGSDRWPFDRPRLSASSSARHHGSGWSVIRGLSFGYYFKIAAEKGVFAPRDAQVFLQQDFNDCRPHAGGNWTKCTQKVGDKFAEYPQFNPWVYSFNVLLPVVDLYQEKNWVPMQKEVRFDLGGARLIIPPWGTNALVLTELVFGWVASLLAIAAFSGLVKTD